jgi:hypothetical protein
MLSQLCKILEDALRQNPASAIGLSLDVDWTMSMPNHFPGSPFSQMEDEKV